MKKLTTYQQEELLALLQIRKDTVEEDPESADELEATDGALDALEEKIKANDTNFTQQEIEWIVGECEQRISIAEANMGNEGIRVMGYANSMQNIIDKITTK